MVATRAPLSAVRCAHRVSSVAGWNVAYGNYGRGL